MALVVLAFQNEKKKYSLYIINKYSFPGIVIHICSPNIWYTKGNFWYYKFGTNCSTFQVPGQQGLHNKILCAPPHTHLSYHPQKKKTEETAQQPILTPLARYPPTGLFWPPRALDMHVGHRHMQAGKNPHA